MRRLGWVTAAFLVLAACSEGDDGRPDEGADQPSSACATRSAAVHRDLPYRTDPGVDPDQLLLDVYEPAREDCEPAPIVVWVHGGGFMVGDKGNAIEDKVALFNDEGWVFASINYRLEDLVEFNPEQAVDVSSAVSWLQDHAAGYGIDPERVLLMGHSAGAYLVAEVGASGADVRCVAPLDTTYEGIQPDDEVEDLPPFFIVTRGPTGRRAGSEALAQRIEEAGGQASVVDANPLTHEEVNHSVGQEGDSVVTPPLIEFFRGCVE